MALANIVARSLWSLDSPFCCKCQLQRRVLGQLVEMPPLTPKSTHGHVTLFPLKTTPSSQPPTHPSNPCSHLAINSSPPTKTIESEYGRSNLLTRTRTQTPHHPPHTLRPHLQTLIRHQLRRNPPPQEIHVGPPRGHLDRKIKAFADGDVGEA
ncbi:uncharacterized protein G2W53_017202 [Senna tora]|uniref:Uncharacterized protein n=1 Tax=Senna tora TaxID=362788 RepID=A0A834WM73_9FABA|nr:uncharacterized protein G2W53_017202 [Senna tora]